ncbi:MAG: heme o synthase [Halobacteriaceae archaeon]
MTHPSRFAGLLAATTIGTYVLLAAGATRAVTRAAASCATWPVCEGRLLAPAGPALAIAWAHRVTAAVVGVAVVAVVVLAWRRGEPRRVRYALGGVAVLYPVQVVIGAVAATGGADGAVAAVHLTVAMTIFSALVVALAWTLEPEATDAPDVAPRGPADAGAAPGETASGGGSLGPVETLRAYVRLTKPRLMWLLCLVAAAGMALAAGPSLRVRTVVLTLVGGVLAIGASGTFNHVFERDRDREMSRTADRPVATDALPRRNAAAFGVALAATSLAVFAQVNLLVAALGLTAILYYSVVYTLLLKPNTVQNTVVGGFAGSLPALIGWAAVTGGVALPGLVLAAVIFLWTPAHFYNLALAYREDYARGGFPMLPVVRGESVTHKHILGYLGATLLAAAALVAVSPLGPLAAATSVAFGAVFLYTVVRLHHERDRAAAFRAFHASNAYLGALLLAVVVDALVV